MKYAGSILLIFFSASCFAQYAKRNNRQSDNSGSSGSIMDKMYFSCGGGLGAGTNYQGLRYSYYSILPTVGYRVKPEILLGINITYSKYSFPDVGVSYDQLGWALFGRYYIQQLFLQAEYDKISSTTPDGRSKKYYDRLLFGVGYTQPLGSRSAINAMALYDVLYQQDGVFQSPFVFRVFFSF